MAKYFAVCAVSLFFGVGAHATQTQPVDLDGNGTAESQCVLDITSSGPTVAISNTVTNRSADAFNFYWTSAGPGGFTSSVPAPVPGVSTTKSTMWQWTTSQPLVGFTGTTCSNDICLGKTSGPDSLNGTCSTACLDGVNVNGIDKVAGSAQLTLRWVGGQATYSIYRSNNASTISAAANALPGTTQQSYSDSDTPQSGTAFYYLVRGTGCLGPATCSSPGVCGLATEGFCSNAGPFGVPGRSKNGTYPVTLSEATLTSSLITFFSPPTEVFRATSSANAGGVTESLTNGGTGDIVVTTPALPPGCCPASEDPHQLKCDDGVCVHYLSDPHNCGACGVVCGENLICANGSCVALCDQGESFCSGQCVNTGLDSTNCGSCGNACDEGSCCAGGGCTPPCDGDLYLCGGECVDHNSDNDNCGSCGNACGEGSCCNAGACTPFICGAYETLCAGGCSNTMSDPNNCGGCGIICEDCCSHGECSGECGTQTSPHPPSCPNLDPTPPVEPYCRFDLVTGHDPASVFPIPPPTEGEAPVCVTEETTLTIHPGATATTCTPGGLLFKEVQDSILVCGSSVPGVQGACAIGTTGTFNRLVADPTIVVGDAYVTPFAVHVVSDTSNDGLIQPGETAKLVIDVLNAGPFDVTQATATLAGPAVDLTDDAVVNPVGITVASGPVAYGTILGTPAATDCTAPVRRPASNQAPFQITVPPNHPGDTIRPLILSVNGTVDGNSFQMDVPLSLGLGSSCNPAAHSRSYDGLDGLANPMAKLVPAGDPVPFPSGTFTAGSTRPLRLRMSCGGVNLTDSDVNPPEIVGLSEATLGALDIKLLNLNSDGPSNPDDPFFRFNNTIVPGGQWTYNMRTALLGRGTFTLTIRIAGRKDYVTGFKLQ